jgi:hypothetical protein
MDMITLTELNALSGRQPDWCVSLYMPTHRHGRDTEQDPIRLKNLLRQAEEQLESKGLRSPDAQQMLEPAQRLLQDFGFWRRQSDGLALFISSEGSSIYRLPLPFTELVVISDRFHLKPLLPFFANDGHFYILALSQNEVRLLEGTRHTVDEIDVENLPTSIAAALQYERFEQELQFHSSSAASGGGKRPAMFHGHDVSDEDKGRILRWFHKLDNELSTLFAEKRSPLVLAGVDYLLPLYQEANAYPHLLPKGIEGNPEKLKPEELHERAWLLVEPIFAQARKEAAARYAQLASDGQATTDIQEAVLAAHHGRVDELFVAVDIQVWGVFDAEANTVSVHEEAEPGDEDLLDLAAVASIANSGVVYAVPREHVPEQAPLAALLRY